MKKIAFILAFIATTITCYAQSQAEMNEKARQEFEKTDALLNKVYQEVLKRGDKDSNKALREAQRAWLKFVDLHMDYVFPLKEGENPREVYGSIYHLEYAMIKTDLFKQRIEQLKY